MDGILGHDFPDWPPSAAGIPFSNFSDRWTPSLNTTEEVALAILVPGNSLLSTFYLGSVEICLTETSSEEQELSALLSFCSSC